MAEEDTNALVERAFMKMLVVYIAIETQSTLNDLLPTNSHM